MCMLDKILLLLTRLQRFWSLVVHIASIFNLDMLNRSAILKNENKNKLTNIYKYICNIYIIFLIK